VGASATQLRVRFAFTPTGTAGAADYVEIAEVQLEEGGLTPFESRPVGTELALCQRYYYRMTPDTALSRLASGMCWTATTGAIDTVFPVTMRTPPTAIEQTGTATHYRVVNASGSGVNLSSVPAFSTASKSVASTTFAVASGLVAGNATYLLPDAGQNGYLGWSAEL
jgi:hypothetical protein